MKTRPAILAFAVLASAASLAAQDVRGTVVQADDVTPAAGAVVLLLSTGRDSIVARIVTGERGTFVLRAPVATPVQLRVLRLGYQPTNAGTFTLTAGQTETVRVKLEEKRIVLAAFDIAATKRCALRPDRAQLVAQLYEEARKALLASASPTNTERNQTQFTLYTRAQNSNGRLTAPVQRTAFSGPSSRPFASLPADSLAKVGYVVDQPDGTIYRAPDADVLLADTFLQTHCLQLVDGTGEQAGFVGIGFKPVNRDTKLIDVQGTLWLDRETNALQYLEYQYAGLAETLTKAGVGGRVDYTQMGNGLWFVNKWAIRMPMYKARNNQRLDGMRGELLNTADFGGLQIIGGEVQWLKVNEETLYNNNGASQAGSDPKDVLDLKVTGGSFEVEATVQKVDASRPLTGMDTVFSSSSCIAVAAPGYTGLVNGRVRDLDQQKFQSVPVVAEWKEDFRVAGQRDFLWQVRRLETRTNASGDYVFCGLPLARPITLSATNNGRKSRVTMVRLTPQDPRTTMNLSVGANIGSAFTAADARYKGAVMFVTDEAGAPVAFATINVGGGANRISDSDGRVMLALAPRDSLKVLVRRVGYAPFEGKVGRDSATGPFRLMLRSNVQRLGTVNVSDRMSKGALELTGFYDRMLESQRGAIVGEFYTPEDLDARPATKVTQFLQASRYLKLGTNDKSTVVTGRGIGCAAAIVMDGVRVRGIVDDSFVQLNIQTGEKSLDAGRQAGKLDINDLISAPQIMAIEIYPSASHAPAAISSQVSSMEGMCSIVAIWTGSRTRK